MKGLDWLKDSAYEHRKVENSEAVIQCGRQMGLTLEQMGSICGVSKTMISHWGNFNRQERPTQKQIQPLINWCGPGRINIVLEPLSPAAREYSKLSQCLITGVILIPLLVGIWFVSIAPCMKHWEECKLLPWYQMHAYQMIENRRLIDDFNEFRSQTQKSH